MTKPHRVEKQLLSPLLEGLRASVVSWGILASGALRNQSSCKSPQALKTVNARPLPWAGSRAGEEGQGRLGMVTAGIGFVRS